MKKQILIFLALFITFSVIAQQKRIKQNQVPQSIRQTFKAKYPDANVKSWEKKNETYIGKFRWNKKKYEVTFDANGKWIKTVRALKWEEVPESVKIAYNKSMYTQWRKDNITQVDSSSGSIVYILEIDNQFNFPVTESSAVLYETDDVYISKNGEIVKVLKKN